MVFSMDHQLLNILISALYLLNEVIVSFLVILELYERNDIIIVIGIIISMTIGYTWMESTVYYNTIMFNFFLLAYIPFYVTQSHYTIEKYPQQTLTDTLPLTLSHVHKYHQEKSLSSIQIIDITTANLIITNVICNIFNSYYY